MSEHFSKTISPKEYYQEPKKSTNLSRRDFFKLAGATGITLALGSNIARHVSGKFSQDSIQKVSENDHAKNTAPQETIQQNDTVREGHDAIGKTFTEQLRTQDHITLDASTKKAIYQYWRQVFAPDTKEYVDVIVNGLERMKPWMNDIRQQFVKEGVPEDFMYIALAESHFKIRAISSHGAVGVYQITKHTANLPSFDMTIARNYDERFDPVASAALCAKHLRLSYEEFGHDWNLALMDYNGGITNLYKEDIKKREETMPIVPRTIDTLRKDETLSHLAQKHNTSITLLKRANGLDASSLSKNETEKEKIASLRPDTQILIPQERKKVSIDDFNAWLEGHINNLIATYNQQSTYTVRSNDTIEGIAKKFALDDPTLITTLNDMPNNRIHEGDQLYIPPSLAEKRAFIMNVLNDFTQNINYPEKFHAIRDIINEQFSNLPKQTQDKAAYVSVPVPKRSPIIFGHRVQHGDTLQKIAKRISKRIADLSSSAPHNPAMILRMLALNNKHLLDEKQQPQLHSRLTLTLEIEKAPTLEDVARKYHTTVTRLQEINPAIIDATDIIPSDALLRIPR